MKKWEYIKRYRLSDKELNELGLKGWELIAVNTHFPVDRDLFYLKREIAT